MVTASRSEVLRKSSVARDNIASSKKMKTRSNPEEMETEEENRLMTVDDVPKGKGRKKKTVSRNVDRVIRTKGKTKEKTLSPAVADVVFGKLKMSIADVDELRWKREEDTLKCGRLVRTVDTSTTRKGSSKKGPVASKNSNAKKNGPQDVHYESPSDSPTEPSNAKTIGELTLILCTHYILKRETTARNIKYCIWHSQ